MPLTALWVNLHGGFVAWLATLESFRGAPPDALVRSGGDRAILRADIVHPDGRQLLVEAELPRVGRHRVQVNRQRLVRSRDLLGVLQVSVFSPDDLALIPAGQLADLLLNLMLTVERANKGVDD